MCPSDVVRRRTRRGVTELLPDKVLSRACTGCGCASMLEPVRKTQEPVPPEGVHRRTGVMSMKMQSAEQIGVCSWSLQSTGAEDLRDKVQAVGVKLVQLGLTAHRGDHGVWGGVQETLGEAGITIISGMFSTIGEDYSTPETIRITGGIVPDQYWDENWKLAQNAAATAEEMGLK